MSTYVFAHLHGATANLAHDWLLMLLLIQKMASNLTNQVRSISEVTKAVAHGNLSKIVDVDVQGEMLDLKETVNSMVAQLSSLANEVIRVSIEVGTEGKLGVQAQVGNVQGTWQEITYGHETVCIGTVLITFEQHVGEYDGEQLDHASPWLRPDIRSRDGR